MAITNIAYPSGSPSLQDDLWHVFNTNVSGQVDYKYVMDLFVGGVQQVRVKLYPEPSNNVGYFNAGPIVRNTTTFYWFTPKEELIVCQPNVSGQVAQTYQYRIGEEYSGTTYLNLVSGNVTAYNFVAPTFKRRVSDLSVYNGKALSNRPSVINANLTDNLYIGAKDVSGVTLATYNQNNTLVTSASFSLLSLRPFIQLNIGPNAINTTYGSALINSSTKYYIVTIGTSVYTINLNCNPKYESFNITFLNHLGLFDTAIFDLASRLTMDVTRKGFEKRDYSLNSNSVTYYDINKKYVDSKVNYLNKKDHSYKLTMNAPTDAEYEWLDELIDSPQVYFELDGYYYPVSIKNNNYEYSKYVNNRLRVFEIDIDINQTRYSQLR